MAIFYEPLFNANHRPGVSGNVFWEPASVKGTNNFYDPNNLIFNDTSTKITAHLAHHVPPNYVGSPAYVIYWKTTATTNDWECDIDYTAIGEGETADPSSAQRSLNQEDTAGGSTDLLQILTIAATAADYTPYDYVLANLARDGTDAGDTMAAAVQVLKAFFKYEDE